MDTGLPPGTEVFSADNHVSVADDICCEHFPDDLKDRAPRVWYEDGAYPLGSPGQSMVVGDFSAVLMQDGDLAGAATNDIDARIRDLAEIGVDKVMWSSDYPYNESTFGYSERSLAAVVDAVGPADAARVVGGNVRKFLGV